MVFKEGNLNRMLCARIAQIKAIFIHILFLHD